MLRQILGSAYRPNPSTSPTPTTPKPKKKKIKKVIILDSPSPSPSTPKPKKKRDLYEVDIPIMGQTELVIPEFFATPVVSNGGLFGGPKYSLVNPLTNARTLSKRGKIPSIKILRKPVEDAVLLSNTETIPLSDFSKEDQDIINKHFVVVEENKGKPVKDIPNAPNFKNKERGRPEVLPKNMSANRAKGKLPNSTINYYKKPKKESGESIESEESNTPFSNYSPPDSPETPQAQPKKRGPYKKHKPSKYATKEERLEAERAQKREWARKAEQRKKGLETPYEKDDWVKGMITDIDKKAKKPKKLSKKAEKLIAEQMARGANAGGVVVGEGIIEKNKIFSNIIMPKSKKVCSECSDDEDIEGMGLYASGGGLYAGNGLYASGGQPQGRGIKHLHHYHRTEMTGEGIVHHHHHIEGGKITMKSIGADIKKAFSPVQKAFEPVKTAFEKVEDVATPYNAEVAAHYLIPAAGAALGGAAGSVVGGPLGGIVGSAGGSYGGTQLNKELGVDDNTTFKGFGMKHKKGSPEAKEWGRRMREARLAKQKK